MLNVTPSADPVGVGEKLMPIRTWLETEALADMAGRARALALVADLRADTHPSGYPDPMALWMLTDMLRQEKFRVIRMQGKGTPKAADIQRLIDTLKQLEALARRARPDVMAPAPWHERWRPLPGIMLVLLSLLFPLALHFLLPLSCLASFPVAGVFAGIMVCTGIVTRSEVATWLSLAVVIMWMIVCPR